MNENKLTVIDSTFAFFIGFLLAQIGVVFITIIGYIVCIIAKIDLSSLQPFFNTALGYLLCVLAMDVVMFLVFWFYKKRSKETFISKPKISKIFLYALIAVLAFIMLYPAVNCFDSWLRHLGVPEGTIPYELSTQNYFISLISLVILPAICEELLFRGIIARGLRKHGKIFSIVLSSLMFTLFHLSISQTIYPLLFGMLLGVIMYYEDNIIYCITAHMTNNFLSLTLAYFNVSLSFNHWSYIMLAVILVVIYLCFILFFVIKNNKSEERNKLSKKETIVLITGILIMLIIWITNHFLG